MARARKAAVNVEPATPAEVREWASAQGLTVNSKGRLSAALREKFTSETGREIA